MGLVILVIVIFIGILGSISFPAYQDWMVRAKVSEAFAEVGEAKKVIAEHVAKNGRYPPDFGSLDIDTGPRPDRDIMASLAIASDASGETVRIVANVASCTWEGGVCKLILTISPSIWRAQLIPTEP